MPDLALSAAPRREVVLHPCPFPARAWWGDSLLAESRGCLRLEERGRSVLYFPLEDVALGQCSDEGHRFRCPLKGEGHLWSVAAPEGPSAQAATVERGPSGEIPRSWRASPTGSGGGNDVLWEFTTPAPGFERLAGRVAFDHERVRVELLDDHGSEDPRDATVVGFPTWGDAGDLIDLLDVRRIAEASFAGVARGDERRPVVEGSQMLGQAVVAARRYGAMRRVVSASMVFTRVADARRPLRFELDELSAGRTFTTLGVHVLQDGRRCATGTVLLDVTSTDVVRHEIAAPSVPGPYESEPYDMGVTGRDLRVVDAAYTDDPDAPVGPPSIDAWVRFGEVPEDPALHDGLLAQFTGHIPIAAALRPHPGVGQSQAHRTLSTAINAIQLAFHAPVHADHWMLYHHRSTFAGDGMTHAACRVHDRSGTLLASFAVDAMVRGFSGRPAKALDDRTAL